MRKERAMKIEQSALAMDASHHLSSEYEFSIDSTQSFRTVFAGVEQADSLAQRSGSDQQARLLMMIEELVGQMLALLSGQQGAALTGLREALPADLPPGGASVPAQGSAIDWSFALTETIREHESSQFTSTGKVLTSDGRALDFTLDLAMCRDFSCERKRVESGTVVLRDPLVINFDGPAALLDGKRFAFDLDEDGSAEALHALGSGSGYLAIDRNADGRINDGSELFGARSGDGFADLAAFDADGNRWLDEADPAFGTLCVWQRDEAGKESLASLRERGVGALYLGSIETPFALTDRDNRLLGQVRASGLYLNEDGRAGSLQQIDLAV
jgi:hypothetical protein